MRFIVRSVLITALLSVLIGGVWLINAIWFKPFSLNTFLNRVVVEFALQSPETLSSLRVLEQFGINFHNDELDNESPEHTIAILDRLEEELAILKSYDDNSLSEDERLSKAIALYLAEGAVERRRFAFHNYPVNQLFGVQNQFPTFMESTHQVNDEEDARDYISRLTKIEQKFDQVLAGLIYREKRDIIPPRFVVERVLAEMKAFVDQSVIDNILYQSLQEKLQKTQIDEALQSEILQDAADAIKTKVNPAYRRLIAYFETLAGKADDRAGVWRLPDGDAYYQAMLSFYTTTDLSPEAIHQLGLREVDRIQAEMLKILASEGYSIESGFSNSLAQLAEEDRFYYPDNAAGREQILKDYQSIIDEITAGMNIAFAKLPKAQVEVKRIPEFKEKTAPGAYYNRPAMDGSRPGIFYANLFDIKATPRYSMRTLAYHEAVPGHHFQISSSMELEDLPLFRRFSPFTAYIEGWALYAERLAWEMGFQKDPFDNLGRLQAELFRAVRLVVDTGLHYKRWSREETISYMAANTGMALSDVTAEVERYIVMPGQACAYKIGMNRILDLRTKAQNELGSRFSLKDFHHVVLENGAVPLAILDQLVERYIETSKESQGATASLMH